MGLATWCSLPFSIHIHVHTAIVVFGLICAPFGIRQQPVINPLVPPTGLWGKKNTFVSRSLKSPCLNLKLCLNCWYTISVGPSPHCCWVQSTQARCAWKSARRGRPGLQDWADWPDLHHLLGTASLPHPTSSSGPPVCRSHCQVCKKPLVTRL